MASSVGDETLNYALDLKKVSDIGSTERQDLEQRARVVTACGLYDARIYSSMSNSLSADDLKKAIQSAYELNPWIAASRRLIDTVRGPLTEKFGRVPIGERNVPCYPAYGPASFEWVGQDQYEQANSSELDSLITLLQFLDFNSQSKEPGIDDYIRAQRRNSYFELVHRLFGLMDLIDQRPKELIEVKDPLWRFCEDLF